jgi:hypothetical protein
MSKEADIEREMMDLFGSDGPNSLNEALLLRCGEK